MFSKQPSTLLASSNKKRSKTTKIIDSLLSINKNNLQQQINWISVKSLKIFFKKNICNKLKDFKVRTLWESCFIAFILFT